MNIPSVPTSLIPSLVQQNNTLESDLLRKLWANRESMLQNPIGSAASDSTTSVNNVVSQLSIIGSKTVTTVDPTTGASSSSTTTDPDIANAISILNSHNSITADYSSVCGRMMTGTSGTMELPASFGSGFNVPTVQETIGLVQHEQSLNNRLADPSDTNTDYCSAVTNTIGNLVNGGKDVLNSVKDSCSSFLGSFSGAFSSGTQSKIEQAAADKSALDAAQSTYEGLYSNTVAVLNGNDSVQTKTTTMNAFNNIFNADYESAIKKYYGTDCTILKTPETYGGYTIQHILSEDIAPGTNGSQNAAATAASSETSALSDVKNSINEVVADVQSATAELKQTVSNTVTAINTAVNNAIHDAVINSLAAIRSLNPCMKAVTDGNGTDGILTPSTKALYDSYDQAKAIANNTP